MRHRGIGRAVFGTLIVALGVVWLLNNFEVTDVDVGELIARYWPVLLILWGISVLTRSYDSQADRAGAGGGGRDASTPASLIVGLIVLVVGVAVLGRNLGLYWLSFSFIWRAFWPVLIILLGWALVRGTSGAGGTHWAFLSEARFRNTGWELRDGGFVSFLGSTSLDLSVAGIPDKETVLSATAVLGGVEITIPPDLVIECEGTAILGSVQFLDEEASGVVVSRRFERKGPEGSPRKVVLRCTAVLGAVEIKRGWRSEPGTVGPQAEGR